MDMEQLGEPDSDFEESKGLEDDRRQHSGDSGAQSPGFVPPDGWEMRGGAEEEINDQLLHSFCTAEGSIGQSSPVSAMSAYWVRKMAVRASTVDPAMMADSCGSMCNSAAQAWPWDTVRTPPKAAPLCPQRDPVSAAAAHLHLLGESLSLIGQHLQGTDKMVSVSSSLSLLLDSLLCAMVPLVCLCAHVPELRSCTQHHTQASTLENIAYVMPGL